MTILSFLFLILLPCTVSFSFNFTNFSTNSQEIILTGGASISGAGIELACDSNNSNPSSLAGRATYIEQFRLWDKTSRKLANFVTGFSFLIDPLGGEVNSYDGFTFFLAQNSSVISGGEAMGLPFNNTVNVSKNPFVAVEFDTHGDVGQDHVGIKVNSLDSIRYRQWLTDHTNKREYEARIEYESDSKTLDVSFTGFQNNTVVWENGLTYMIDLRDVLPERVILGFSASSSLEKHNIRSWFFNSPDVSRLPKPNTSGLLIGLAIGISVPLILLVSLVFILWRRKKKTYGGEVEEGGFGVEMDSEFEMGAAVPRRFVYSELGHSTAGFSEKEKLGQGGFGGVYKGFLKDQNTFVAVKRVSKTSKQGIKEYASEVRVISRLRHRNLVQLVGWCHEKGELLLVYEYMENGSLDLHLFKEKSLLTWGTRQKIAIGLASAILYLHEEWKQCVLHRDIKSSNVMLDSDFNAKLGDFGLAKLVDHEKGFKTTMLAGTLGYMAPECVVTSKATKESDVFSFGVVALEIACGRNAIMYKNPGMQIRLIDWVWDLYGNGTLFEAVDSRLELDFKEEEEIMHLMTVGLWCVHPDSKLRPTMREAIQVLKCEAPILVLPSKMPVASYLTPSSVSNSQFSNPSISTTSSILLGR